MIEFVEPQVRANGLWNSFTGLKKWTINCGKCQHTWQEKVPIQEFCSAVCPCCRIQNRWSAREFRESYEWQLAARKELRRVEQIEEEARIEAERQAESEKPNDLGKTIVNVISLIGLVIFILLIGFFG